MSYSAFCKSLFIPIAINYLFNATLAHESEYRNNPLKGALIFSPISILTPLFIKPFDFGIRNNEQLRIYSSLTSLTTFLSYKALTTDNQTFIIGAGISLAAQMFLSINATSDYLESV